MAALLIAFASLIRSGVTPKYSAAVALPSRPKPVMTSSKISRMPCFVQISRSFCRYHGGDGRRIVQRDNAFEFIGEMRAPRRLTLRKCVVFGCVRMRQMIDVRQQPARKRLAVRPNAADRDTTETHAVIPALAANQLRALAFAACTVIGEGDFQRGIDGLGAGIREEDAVEAFRHDRCNLRGRFERERVAHLEGR